MFSDKTPEARRRRRTTPSGSDPRSQTLCLCLTRLLPADLHHLSVSLFSFSLLLALGSHPPHLADGVRSSQAFVPTSTIKQSRRRAESTILVLYTYIMSRRPLEICRAVGCIMHEAQQEEKKTTLSSTLPLLLPSCCLPLCVHYRTHLSQNHMRVRRLEC